ncbi:MAG: molybdopterin converting factor subunit 1 [Alphaproteobacteria bacterium]|jgi:molybdopterin synthase sulfur carrier subunit
MKLLYFAWLRTKIGIASEEVEPPETVVDVDGLLAWLADRGPGYAEALANRDQVRVAVNQDYVAGDHALESGDEVALFPPVTGG